LRRSPGVKAIRDDVRRELLAGETTAPLAADRLLAAYDENRRDEESGTS
jgi:LAO/AO transport system kinase